MHLLQHPYKDLIITIIQEAHITTLTDLQKLSSGQKQILGFLSLLLFKNKVILADELLSNVSIKLKKILYEKIKPLITASNLLVVVDHDINVKNHFKHTVEVDTCIKNH